MNISNTEIPIEEIENREKAYELYYDILEEIKGKKVLLDPKEYEELILTTKITTILHYIKESIPILINKKIENLNSKKQRNELNTKEKETTKFSEEKNENIKYENQMKNLESQLRFYLKKCLQYKIQRESLELRLKAYMEMEIEFENMKEKVKYEGGEFLHNDRKENEIEILRRENSNLKNAISKIEEEKKKIEFKRENDQKMIVNLKNQVEKLEKKIIKLEKEQNNFNSNQNSSINININNNGKTSSKWIIKRDDKFTNENNQNKNKNSNYEHRSSNFNLIDNQVFTSTYYKILNNLSNKSTLSPGKNPRHKHKKNSISHIDDKNYSLNNNYHNYNKVSSLISNRKFPMNRNSSKQTISTFSRIYSNNNKHKSGNRSTNNIRNKSAENYI